MLDIVLDVFIDTVKIIPFLYITFLVMEYLEDVAKTGSIKLLKKYPAIGPVVGSAAGAFPQCGFSAAASSLYSGGVITLGTLIAIFLSTSDEMLPILISEKVSFNTILSILGMKFVIGLISGLIIDAVFKVINKKHPHKEHHIHDICEDDHCGCEENHNIFLASLKHTVEVAFFIFVVSFLAACLIEGIGQDNLSAFLEGNEILGVFLAALVGLIPNCGASVALTTLYLNHLITYGQAMAGLLVSAGVGLVVLFRTNRRNIKGSISIVVLLYIIGVLWGLILSMF
ncbi:MAG: arsenic efflux protein [Lachnospiraceae bacterium]|nr:arsenic efflux protein [Lachnospiraceae bacterium]